MQNKSILALSLNDQLLALKNQFGYIMFSMAEILKKIRDDELYISLGYDNFSEYVRNPEIGMNLRTAYYYIQIYEVFIEGLGYDIEELQKYSYDRLRKIAPIMVKQLTSGGHKETTEVQQIMDDAVYLRWYDFEKIHKDKEANEGFEDYLESPEFYRCSKCKKWIVSIPITDCCDDWLGQMYQMLVKRFDKGGKRR